MGAGKRSGITVGKIKQVQSLVAVGVLEPLQPELDCPVGIAPEWRSGQQGQIPEAAASQATDKTSNAFEEQICSPVEHDPLGNSDYAVLGFGQSRQLVENGIVVVRHVVGGGIQAEVQTG